MILLASAYEIFLLQTQGQNPFRNANTVQSVRQTRIPRQIAINTASSTHFFFFFCRTDPTPKVSTHRQRTLSPRARAPVNAESDKAIRKYIASSADAAPVHRKKQNYPLSRSNPLMPPPTHPADAIKSDSAVGVNYFEFPFFFAMRRRPFETPRRPLNGPLSLTGDS